MVDKKLKEKILQEFKTAKKELLGLVTDNKLSEEELDCLVYKKQDHDDKVVFSVFEINSKLPLDDFLNIISIYYKNEIFFDYHFLVSQIYFLTIYFKDKKINRIVINERNKQKSKNNNYFVIEIEKNIIFYRSAFSQFFPSPINQLYEGYKIKKDIIKIILLFLNNNTNNYLFHDLYKEIKFFDNIVFYDNLILADINYSTKDEYLKHKYKTIPINKNKVNKLSLCSLQYYYLLYSVIKNDEMVCEILKIFDEFLKNKWINEQNIYFLQKGTKKEKILFLLNLYLAKKTSIPEENLIDSYYAIYNIFPKNTYSINKNLKKLEFLFNVKTIKQYKKVLERLIYQQEEKNYFWLKKRDCKRINVIKELENVLQNELNVDVKLIKNNFTLKMYANKFRNCAYSYKSNLALGKMFIYIIDNKIMMSICCTDTSIRINEIKYKYNQPVETKVVKNIEKIFKKMEVKL